MDKKDKKEKKDNKDSKEKKEKKGKKGTSEKRRRQVFVCGGSPPRRSKSPSKRGASPSKTVTAAKTDDAVRTEVVRAPVIKYTDMTEKMQKDCIECAMDAYKKLYTEQQIAHTIRAYFEKKYGATWHCIVGRNFGAFFTNCDGTCIYFYIGQIGFLLFRSGEYI